MWGTLGEWCGAFLVAFLGFATNSFVVRNGASDKGDRFLLHNTANNCSLAQSVSTQHYSFSVCSVVSHLHHWIKAVTIEQKAHSSLLMKGSCGSATLLKKTHLYWKLELEQS